MSKNKLDASDQQRLYYRDYSHKEHMQQSDEDFFKPQPRKKPPENFEKGQNFLDDIATSELEIGTDQAQEWREDIAADIDYIIPFDCIARDIQTWILKTSMYPQPAIAFIATMSLMSTLIGRTMRYENIKGTFMCIAMAESGEGKDYPLKCCEAILEAVGQGDRIHKKMASGAALMEALDETPSMLFQIDEIGNYLESINGHRASSYSREISGIVTECYTSGHKKFTGKRTKGAAPEPIYEPNLSVMGTSTERQVFDGVTTSGIADGSLARYFMVFGKNNLIPRTFDLHTQFTPPNELINKIKELVFEHHESVNAPYLYSKHLKITPEYHDEKNNMSIRLKQRANDLTGDKRAFKPFYNRSIMRIVQMSMAIDKCRSIEVMNWCEQLEVKTLDVFIKKFNHLGADNENEKQTKILQAKIKEAGVDGISAAALLQKTRMITSQTRKTLIAEMIESGVIYTEKVRSTSSSKKPITKYFWKK